MRSCQGILILCTKLLHFQVCPGRNILFKTCLFMFLFDMWKLWVLHMPVMFWHMCAILGHVQVKRSILLFWITYFFVVTTLINLFFRSSEIYSPILLSASHYCSSQLHHLYQNYNWSSWKEWTAKKKKQQQQHQKTLYP